MIKTNISGLRDPFILYENGVYYAYGTDVVFEGDWVNTKYGCFVNKSGKLDGEWVKYEGELYITPQYAEKNFWAPEVHKYKGKFYMFATYFSSKTQHRGCTILKSDSPTGPFVEITNGLATPEDWDAIDGTLFVDEKGDPYMIFVHEWTCTEDKVGSMAFFKLSEDLTHAISEPVEMFRATDAAWCNGKITDGCFMYKTENGELLMLWSNADKDGYAEGVARSKNGTLEGPWSHDEPLLYCKSMSGEYDGGHGMLFKDEEGVMYMTLHSPNHPNENTKENTVIIKVREENNGILAEI